MKELVIGGKKFTDDPPALFRISRLVRRNGERRQTERVRCRLHLDVDEVRLAFGVFKCALRHHGDKLRNEPLGHDPLRSGNVRPVP